MLLVVLENACNLKMLLCYIRKTLQCVPSTVGGPFQHPKRDSFLTWKQSEICV